MEASITGEVMVTARAAVDDAQEGTVHLFIADDEVLYGKWRTVVTSDTCQPVGYTGDWCQGEVFMHMNGLLLDARKGAVDLLNDMLHG
jgi:hypothetical protein